MPKPRRCEWSDIRHLAPEARREGVTLKPHVLWWTIGGIACAGLLWIGRRRARLCGCYVRPEYRDRGIGESLLNSRFRYALRNGASIVDSFAYRARWFIDRGFVPRRRFKMGTVEFIYRAGNQNGAGQSPDPAGG